MRIQTTLTVSVIGDNGREIHRSVHKARSNHFDMDGADAAKVAKQLNHVLSVVTRLARATTDALAGSLLS